MSFFLYWFVDIYMLVYAGIIRGRVGCCYAFYGILFQIFPDGAYGIA